MDIAKQKIRAPFPYFGGKSKIANEVWKHFEGISNYVEPFAGSLAVLLASPYIPKMETINDADCMVINFWRAVTYDVENVIKYADHPVHETELHARHRYILANITDEFLEKMDKDPYYFNSEMAGYWLWGMGASVGNNWLQPKGLKAMPLLSSAGGGIHGLTSNIEVWMKQLKERLRRVRMVCGDWKKLTTPAVLWNNVGLGKNETTGIFLDPPYLFFGRDKVYREENNVWMEAFEWAMENGNNPKLKIALCGYDIDLPIKDAWTKFYWQTGGGLANLGDSRGKDNAKKEIILFNC